MKKRFLFILALLCTVMQGAWADEWDAVCWQTNTAQADWTPLSAGSTTGHTLGSAGTTTYYYITQNLNFSNSTAGGSGLTILGTVYLYIPSGLTLTCTGANASGQTGAGAGVELAEGNALYLIGSGTVNATGGNATNGGTGGTGGDATGYNGDWTETGTGGNGGNGGGGAGAGIGTHGGNGGSGGSGGSGYKYTDWKTHNGTDGSAGGAGYNAGAMGNIYVYRTYQQTAAVTVNATGGAAGSTGGSGGQRGRGYAYDGYSHNYTVAGGGGGGAGGFGGAASNIGTGGPGGGGGGGGAGGAQDYRSNSSGGVYAVTAPGGKGGKNADGSSAADGTEAVTNGTAQSQGWVTVDNGSFSSSDWHYASGDVAFGNGGNGGAKGNASNASAAEYVWRSLVLGSGTESDPYQISSAADLNQLAANVNSGTTYENKYFVQTGDITYETAGLDETASNYEAIGNHFNDRYFKGHYDGANHTISGIRIYKGSSCQGLFGPIGNGGSVKNVILADTRITGGLFYGGIAGICEGGTVSNCHVLNTVTLCNIKSMSSYGGIVGYNSGGTVSGCTSAAAFTTADGAANNAITFYGGIVGLNISGTVSDCIYFGTSFDGAGIRGAIVGNNQSKGTVTNSYYTDTNITGMSFNGTVLDNEKCAIGVNEGTITNCGLARAVATAPASLGELVRDYGTLQVYQNGILYDGKYYYVKLPILSGTGEENDPYLISNANQWYTFAVQVNNGTTTYSDKFVKLTSDISVETMVGTSYANSFQGTFDGGGHTLTVNYNSSENNAAPFSHVSNATIKNLRVAGTITTSAPFAGGIVSESHGALTLSGCVSSVAINSSKSGDGTHGGLVSTLSGRGNAIIIEGCVFDGSFATTTGTVGCGGFIGWGVYNKPVIRNSLLKPSSVGANMLGSNFARWYTGDGGIYEPTFTDCYYVATDNLPTDQGTQVYAFDKTPTDLGALVKDYGMVKAYENAIIYDGKYYAVPASISLADNADNRTTVSDNDGYVADVTLTGRTLYKDGAWNTICLPFDVVLEGSALEGAVARPLTAASISGTTLNLTFGDAVTTLTAGTPYIIKWESGNNIVSPVFYGVTIDKTDRSYDNGQSGDIRVRFLGTYKSTAFDSENKSILLMGGENTLYYPTSGAGIGAQRAYFKIGSDAALARRLTSFNIDFGGDDETTGIIELKNSRIEELNSVDAWFSLDGRKLDGKPTRTGLYINNGNIVVIKH